MTTVLIIGYVWPEPRSSAAGTRMMQLIELFLQQGWRIIYASPAAPSEHMADLRAIGVSMQNIELNDASFDHFIGALQPQIVIFDRFMMEEQFAWRVERSCPNALRILDTEDLHFLRCAREQACKQDREVSPADLYGELAQREVAAIFRSDLSLIISDYEIRLLQDRFAVPSRLLAYCPFMVEATQSRQTTPDYAERAHFISIGNFRHAPNWDAVVWLKHHIWPQIRNALPAAELHIYGAYLTKKAMNLHNPEEGFHVLGWARDAKEVMTRATVCLAPLRFGAGLKGKLVDAMQFGTPNVTTTIGAEGMAGKLPWSGLVADSAKEFAAAAVELHQNETLWRSAQQRGYEIIARCFDKTTIGETVMTQIEQCMSELHSHRLANFTGAMLRHHQHKSTQYMSQWIETKNKLHSLTGEKATP